MSDLSYFVQGLNVVIKFADRPAVVFCTVSPAAGDGAAQRIADMLNAGGYALTPAQCSHALAGPTTDALGRVVIFCPLCGDSRARP